jgi:hypothetical protein
LLPVAGLGALLYVQRMDAPQPAWIIRLERSGSESYGKWWYGGLAAPSSRRLASTPQGAYHFTSRTTAESLAETFREQGDQKVEVLEVPGRELPISSLNRGARSQPAR